ncbi:MAG: glycine cleavage system aminomethyltransferase GcvT [Clostridia bacterium]
MTKRTALYDTHIKYGGKIVEFAGYELPVQYKNGIIFEHNIVRNGVGLFDVSHMGEVLITGENAENALQKLVTNRVSTIAENQCRYTLMCYASGGIVDDLLIYKYNTKKYLLVVNAANVDKDFDWIINNLDEGAKAENISNGITQIAIQGPKSKDVLSKITDMSKIPEKMYHFADNIDVGGIECLVSTTGYTGESGYEVYCDNKFASKLYEILMTAGSEFDIQPIGLGARDTLRFESSMPLYGHELTKDTLATEVGLDMFVKLDCDFIGRDALVANKPKYERIGLILIDKGIAREHFEVLDKEGNIIGMTTSGGICPTIGGAYAMARVLLSSDTEEVYIQVRNKRLLAKRVDLPFYKRSK